MPEEAAEDSAGPKQIFGVSTHNNTEEEGMSDDDCNDDDDAWGQSFRTTAAVAAIHSFIYLARSTGDIRSRSVLSYRYEGGRGAGGRGHSRALDRPTSWSLQYYHQRVTHPD